MSLSGAGLPKGTTSGSFEPPPPTLCLFRIQLPQVYNTPEDTRLWDTLITCATPNTCANPTGACYFPTQCAAPNKRAHQAALALAPPPDLTVIPSLRPRSRPAQKCAPQGQTKCTQAPNWYHFLCGLLASPRIDCQVSLRAYPHQASKQAPTSATCANHAPIPGRDQCTHPHHRLISWSGLPVHNPPIHPTPARL